MKDQTVLFPAVGGESTVAAIQSLRAEWPGPGPLRLLGCETDSDKRAYAGVDRFFTSPRRDDPGYLDYLLRICIEEGVDVLWPNPTEEQLLLAGHRDHLEAAGVQVLVPPASALDVLADKRRTYEYAEALGIQVPAWRAVTSWDGLCATAEEFGYPRRPVVFRRTFGRGGIGVRVLSEDPAHGGDFFNQPADGMIVPLAALRPALTRAGGWPSCMVCEFLPGKEFDVDCLCARGTLKAAVARRNDALWWGTSSRAETVDRPDLVSVCARLLEALGWEYICSATFREDAHGTPKLLEVNTRMPACINLSWKAGYNFPLAALQMALGREPPPFDRPTYGVKLIRYFGESYLMP